MYPPSVEEIIERKDAVLKALVMLDILQEQKRLSNAEYQTQIKTQKSHLQTNMDWLKSKGIISLEEEEITSMDEMERSLTATY